MPFSLPALLSFQHTFWVWEVLVNKLNPIRKAPADKLVLHRNLLVKM